MTKKHKKVDFDKFTNNYDQLLKEGTEFFSKSDYYFAEYKVKRTYDFYKPKKNQVKILEYGCGTGRNISFLKKYYPNAIITGADISLKSLQIAKKNNPNEKFVHVKEVDGQFDLIFIAGVFHHIHPDLRVDVASHIKTLLKHNGLLIIFEHNPFNPITRRIVDKCPYDEDAILLYPSQLKKLFRDRLDFITNRYTLFVPPIIPFSYQADKMLSLIPLGGQFMSIFYRK